MSDNPIEKLQRQLHDLLEKRIQSEPDPARRAKLDRFKQVREDSERELAASLAHVKFEMDQLNDQSWKLGIAPPLERFGDITTRVMEEHSALIHEIALNVRKQS